MKNIWFIRHGQSEANAGLKTRHPAITQLTDSGKIQAKHIADYIHIKPDLIIHSPYLRALQTAQPTMDRFPGVLVEQWPVQEFTYLSPDKYFNTTRFERQAFVAQYWEACKADLKDGEHAESFYDFFHRVKSCHQQLNGTRKNVLIFTHGHVMRFMIWMILLGSRDQDDYTMEKYKSLRSALSIANGAILKTRITDDNAVMSSLITQYLPDSLLTG